MDIKKYFSVIEELNKMEASVLELLATYLYLIEMEENEEIIRKKLKIIKPHLFYRFDDALRLWKKIKIFGSVN